MTLGDLYPDVRLYSEVDYNYDRVRWEGEIGGSGRTCGNGRSGQRWQGDKE